MRRTRPLVAVAATTTLAAGAALGLSATASAHPSSHPDPVVVSDQLAAPFNLEVDRHKVLVADGGLGSVSKVNRDGSLTTIVADVEGASGVATSWGRLAYTSTTSNPETFENTASSLTIKGWGRTRVADTLAYEQKRNPDQVISYGIDNPTECQTETLESIGFPVSYTGAIDSHAYSVTSWGSGWVVADAGGNDLLFVDSRGKIRRNIVLPAQPAVLTQEAADMFGLDDCVVGVEYGFESVPTDVEVGRNGMLYVTTLPGGPEDESLGARGAVYRVNPWTGKAKKVADGFLGATNLALGDRGEIYVAELFGGKISVVKGRSVSTYVELPFAVAVESGRDGSLWAATLGNEDPPAPGTVVKLRGGKHHH
jgi:hypothetical protein